MEFGSLRAMVQRVLEDRGALADILFLLIHQPPAPNSLQAHYLEDSLRRTPCGSCSAWDILTWCLEGRESLEAFALKEQWGARAEEARLDAQRWLCALAWALAQAPKRAEVTVFIRHTGMALQLAWPAKKGRPSRVTRVPYERFSYQVTAHTERGLRVFDGIDDLLYRPVHRTTFRTSHHRGNRAGKQEREDAEFRLPMSTLFS